MSNWWQGYPWRLIQTNLREIDMLDIDAEQVVRDMQAFDANILMINAAGIIASYPTDLAYHFQSPYLQSDSLAEIIDACHAADIRVIARTDFSKIRRPIYEANPEWAYVSPAGEIVDYNGDVACCLNGGYQQDYAFKILEEMLTRLPFDGIFFNMGGYQTSDYSGTYFGPCQCANCRRLFQEMFSLDLPVVEDMDDPVFRKYTVFKSRTLRAHGEKVYDFLHEAWPELCIASHPDLTEGFKRQENNTAIKRPLPHWQYSGSDNTKWLTSSFPNKVSSNASVDFIDYPFRHVAVSPHQQKLRLAQALANGGALDYYLIGRLDNHEDRSGYAPVKEMFAYHAANEGSYRGLTSKANIALLNGPLANQNEFRGWFRFLIEGHFLFDTLMESAALDLPWDRYEAIILPDFQPVSDALARKLDNFVAAGGTLIASGRSSFRDEGFEPRALPALACLGMTNLRLVRQDMSSSYFKFENKDGFPRFDDIDLLYIDGPYVYADYETSVERHLHMIPPHNFGPPERCYYELETEDPGLLVNAYGEGKAIYLPWLPGSLFHRQGYPNTSEFIADVLEQAAGLTPVSGNLSPMVEVTRYRQAENGWELIHLVNGSGHFGVSFFEPVMMVDLEVAVEYAQTPAKVRSLVNQCEYESSWQDGRLTIRVPVLGLFDAIQVALV
jgi:hypothetical protein